MERINYTSRQCWYLPQLRNILRQSKIWVSFKILLEFLESSSKTSESFSPVDNTDNNLLLRQYLFILLYWIRLDRLENDSHSLMTLLELGLVGGFSDVEKSLNLRKPMNMRRMLMVECFISSAFSMLFSWQQIGGL